MNTTIGIGILLLGGWVLPPVDPVAEQPASTIEPMLDLWPDSPTPEPEAHPTDVPRLAPQRDEGSPRTEPRRRQMPVAPTGPGAGSRVPLGAPTADLAPGYGGLGQAPGMNPYRMSAATHGRRTGGTGKAFTGYRRASAISPYLNLYRTDNSFGTVDNYYTLVKPLVDQRTKNTRFNTQIRGLQNTSRHQGAAIHTLDRETRTLQGISTPQYYQNYRDYYPGSRR